MRFGMKKFDLTFILTFSVLLSTVFVSCDSISESFAAPMKQFFQENTESSTIAEFEFLGNGAVKGDDGYWHIPSSADFSIKLLMKNPQAYNFAVGSNMVMTPLWDEDEVFALTGKTPRYEASLSQLQTDPHKSTLILTFQSEFLLEYENGIDISPLIELYHPVSYAKFDPYSNLKIKSNTAPPPTTGATVYHDGTKYFLAFNMPSSSMLSGIHSDVSSLDVSVYNGSNRLLESKKCAVAVNSNGTFTLSGDDATLFTQGNQTSSYIPTNSSTTFVVNGQPVMFESGVSLTDTETIFRLTLTDKAGLRSVSSVGAKSTRLSEVSISDVSGNILSSASPITISEDPGKHYSTIKISASDTAIGTSGETISGLKSRSKVSYEIYRGSSASGTCIATGSANGENSVQLKNGTYFLKAYSQLDGYADSIPVGYTINVDISTSSVYVASYGDDSENDGSEMAPLKTIAAAISSFTSQSNERNTVILLSDITEDLNITSSQCLTISGGSHKLTGNIDFSGDKLALSNVNLSGEITLKAAGKNIAVSSLKNTTPITLKIDSSVASSYILGHEIIVPQTGATLTESDVSKIKLDSTDYSIRLDPAKNSGVISDLKATAGDNPEGDPTGALTDFGFDMIYDEYTTSSATSLSTEIDIIINLSSADSKFNSVAVESLEVEIYSGSVKLSGVTTYPDSTKKSARVEVAEIYVGNYTVVVKAKINGIFYTSQKIIKVDFGT